LLYINKLFGHNWSRKESFHLRSPEEAVVIYPEVFPKSLASYQVPPDSEKTTILLNSSSDVLPAMSYQKKTRLINLKNPFSVHNFTYYQLPNTLSKP
jgi:hypothetical protein